MADQTTDQAQGASPALAEPTVHVRNGWVAGLGLASLGMWMASYTPLQVLLPTQLQDIDAARQDRRPGRGVRLRRDRVRHRHADRRGAVRQHHAAGSRSAG